MELILSCAVASVVTEAVKAVEEEVPVYSMVALNYKLLGMKFENASSMGIMHMNVDVLGNEKIF